MIYDDLSRERTPTRIYFVVMNKGAQQFYLSSDTRKLTSQARL